MSSTDTQAEKPLAGLAYRLGSNFGWSAFGDLAAKGATVFYVIYLARVLGVEQYGLLATFHAAVLYVWLIADLGIAMHGSRAVSLSRANPSDTINTLVSARICSSTVCFIAYSVAILVYADDAGHRTVGLLVGVYLLAMSVNLDWALRGLEAFRTNAIINVVVGTSLVVALLVLVDGPEDIVPAAVLLASASGLAAIVQWLALRSRRILVIPHFSLRDWTAHIRQSVLFALSGAVSSTTQHLPIVVVGAAFGPQIAGLLAAPLRIVYAICGLGYMLPSSAYPLLAHLHASDLQRFAVVVHFVRTAMLALAFVLSVGGLVWSEEFIHFVLGDAYMAAIPVFEVLMGLTFLLLVRFGYGTALAASGMQGVNLAAACVGFLVLCISGIGLLPLFGSNGAAIAMVLAEAALLGWLILRSRRVFSAA